MTRNTTSDANRALTDGGWDVTERADTDEYVPLDMANNIADERVRGRIAWIDGFGRAYADALKSHEAVTDGGTEPTKHDEWTLLETELDCITERAKGRFMEEFDRREDWKNFEARYHVYKAHDQLSVASYHSRQDDVDELVKTNLADAVNHMLMAMATLDIDHDECQPIQTEEGTRTVMTDGGQTESATVLVVFQTYEDDADLETDDAGTVTNHDELVDAGQTYREIRYLHRNTVEKFDMTRVDEDHPLWCDAVADLERGDSLRVDELRGEADE